MNIDDDHGCQLSVARFLTLVGGHRVETAYTGRAGLERAAELLPDIILLDLMLPDIDGMEVLAGLRENPATSSIPVIMITGADLDETKERCLLEHRNLKLIEQKPLRLSALLKKMNIILSDGAPAAESGDIRPADSPA